MSKEAMERILKAEDEARQIIKSAQEDADECIRAMEEKINGERIALLEKLKSGRNEKIRRASMQLEVSREEAGIKAKAEYENARQEYEKYRDAAVQAAIDAVFE